MKLKLAILFMGASLAVAQEPKKDMPPLVVQPLTAQESGTLDQAAMNVVSAQIALADAQRALDDAKYKIEKHAMQWRCSPTVCRYYDTATFKVSAKVKMTDDDSEIWEANGTEYFGLDSAEKAAESGDNDSGPTAFIIGEETCVQQLSC